MYKKLTYLLFSCLVSTGFTNAQVTSEVCGTELLDQYHQINTEGYLEFREYQTSYLNQYANTKSACSITIPVVIHVLYYEDSQNISNEQIYSQIDILNKDFNKLNWDTIKVPSVWKSLIANCGIKFVLANRDPDGNLTSGITRTKTTVPDIASNPNSKLYYQTSKGGHDIWDRDQYLNIWVCEAGNYYGFASKPGAPAVSDGVVIAFRSFGISGTAENPTDLGRTATHEVGHWLDLKHIWGDAVCGDDGVNDTPVQEGSTSGCPFFPEISCSNGPNGNMFMNFMDYSDDHCLNMFTIGQSDRMCGTINSSRSSLFNSKGYNGISEIAGLELSIYPNPAHDHITISSDDWQKILKMELYDSKGSLFYSTNNIDKITKVSTQNYTNGIYFLKVHTKGGVFTDKIVVWHH